MNTSTSEENYKSGAQISLGANILLTLATSLSYALCYAFYCGNFGYFQIPFSLIEIRITDLLVLFIFSTVILQFSTGFLLGSGKVATRYAHWYMLLGIALLLLVQGMLFDWSTKAWLSEYVFFGSICFLGFLYPLPFHLRNRRLEHNEPREKSVWKKMCQTFSPVTAHFLLLVFLSCAFLIPFMLRAGKYLAERDVSYYLYDYGNKTCAVAAVLSDKFICVDFDPKGKGLYKKFQVVPFSSGPRLRYEHVGPLHKWGGDDPAPWD